MSSGKPLSVSPPPPPTIFKAPRRSLVGITAASSSGLRSLPPPPGSDDADWQDLREDAVTDVYAERVTLVFEKEDESTRELPRPTLRRLPAPPSAPVSSSPPPLPPPRAAAVVGARLPRVVSLPPAGFDTLSASLAAASLPPPGFAAALRANEAPPPPPLAIPFFRVAAALAVAAVVALLALALRPAKGTIVVSATDARGAPVGRLDVFVDGKATPCTATPCSLSCAKGLHEVKVIGEGFEVPATQAVAVGSGDAAAAQFIVGSSSASGFKVSGSQEGVTLAVDGSEVGPLPQVVRDLVPGDHTIELAGSERYQPITRHVIVERDKVEDLGAITLKVVKGNVTVMPGTPGARVYLVSGADRRELWPLPTAVDIDTSMSWSLEATKDGYRDYRQPIDFDDGRAKKTLSVSLEPEATAERARPAPAREVRVTAAPQAHPAPVTPAAKAPAPAAQASRGAADGARGGYLNINSLPASTCFLDGTALGSTPRLLVSVNAGPHTVKFRSPDRGATKTLVVNVGAGETRLAVARLN